MRSYGFQDSLASLIELSFSLLRSQVRIVSGDAFFSFRFFRTICFVGVFTETGEVRGLGAGDMCLGLHFFRFGFGLGSFGFWNGDPLFLFLSLRNVSADFFFFPILGTEIEIRLN